MAHAVRLWPSDRNAICQMSDTLEELWKQHVATHADAYRAAARKKAEAAYNQRTFRDTVAELEKVNEENRRKMERMLPALPQPGPYRSENPNRYGPPNFGSPDFSPDGRPPGPYEPGIYGPGALPSGPR